MSKNLSKEYRLFIEQQLFERANAKAARKWKLIKEENGRVIRDLLFPLQVAVSNGYLYALGGHDCPASNPSVCRTDTVERYDPGTDTWTLVSTHSTHAI